MNNSRETLHDAAQRYAAKGWPVFPVRPDDPSCPRVSDPKAPRECKAPITKNGFKDATIDHDQIAAWWRRAPKANVGIRTGAPGPDVVDVDVKPDGTGYPALRKLQQARLVGTPLAVVRTPSFGAHLFFAGTDQPTSLRPRDHIDFKACGGYVVAAPSTIHGGRRYAQLREQASNDTFNWQAAADLLEPPHQPRREFQRTTEAGDKDIADLVEWVASRQPGDRRYPLFWAARKVARWGRLDADTSERFVDAALRAGLRGGEREARRTVEDALKYASQQDTDRPFDRVADREAG
jgi:hypothetical protein